MYFKQANARIGQVRSEEGWESQEFKAIGNVKFGSGWRWGSPEEGGGMQCWFECVEGTGACSGPKLGFLVYLETSGKAISR